MMPDCAKKETHEKIRQGAGGFRRAGSCLRRAGHTYVSLGLHLVQQAGSVVVALEQSKASALVRGLVEEIPVTETARQRLVARVRSDGRRAEVAARRRVADGSRDLL